MHQHYGNRICKSTMNGMQILFQRSHRSWIFPINSVNQKIIYFFCFKQLNFSRF